MKVVIEVGGGGRIGLFWPFYNHLHALMGQ